MKHVRLLGIRVDDVTFDEALDAIDQMIVAGGAHQVVTVNPEFVMRAQQDAAFRQVLEAADLAIPDGQGLLLGARLLGERLRERVAGSDMVPALAALAAPRAYRVFLLGAAPGVADRAAEILEALHPGLIVAGTYSGSPAAEDAADIVARVEAARPHLLFVAYGAPAQDLWIYRNQPKMQVPVAMGVGGSLDFIVGVQRRAPVWIQTLGLEWLYRLVQEPRRWRRMLALPRFVVGVVGQAIVQRRRTS